MAGRPRKRAKEALREPAVVPRVDFTVDDPLGLLAPSTAAQSPILIDDDGNIVPRETDPIAEMAPVSSSRWEARTTEPVDLAQWWRDHVAAIERDGADRTRLLADAGAHPSEIFAQQARMFAGMGLPRDVAATLLGLPESEFDVHYGADYTVGRAQMIMPVAANMLRIATSSEDRFAVKAATEVLNRLGGEEWRPPAQKLEIDDSRKSKAGVIDSSKLSWEDRQVMRGILERATGRAVEALPSGVAAGTVVDGSVDGDTEEVG
jgi:hypothetical protein